METYIEEILYKDSRIKILTDKKPLIKQAFDELVKQRTIIENYIKEHPFFLATLKPYKIQPNAPEIIKLMSKGVEIANVGPMAAVAGTIAEFLARFLRKKGANIAVVENGGDIFAITSKEIIIGLFSGQNKVAEKLAFKLNTKNTPLAICYNLFVLSCQFCSVHPILFCDLSHVHSS